MKRRTLIVAFRIVRTISAVLTIVSMLYYLKIEYKLQYFIALYLYVVRFYKRFACLVGTQEKRSHFLMQ